MTTTFAANLEALEERYPEVAAAVRKSPGIPPTAQLGRARAGGATLRLCAPDGTWVGVHSAYDPAAEAERQVEAAGLADATLLVVHGLGLGYHVHAAVRRLGRCALVAVLEPRLDALVAAMHGLGDLARWIRSRSFLLLAGDGEAAVLRAMGERAGSHLLPAAALVRVLVTPGLDRASPGLATRLLERLWGLLRRARIAAGNDPADTLLGLEHILANMPSLAEGPSLDALAGRWRGVPAVCVAAGPSLDRDIEALRRSPGRALVLAADIILERLLREGIVPDAVGRHERTRFGHEHYFQGRPIPREVVLLARPVICPETVAGYPGPVVGAVADGLPYEEWALEAVGGGVGRMGGVPRSVAHLNYLVARTLGCDPIVLVGQDLAFGEDGRHYASGTVKDAQRTRGNEGSGVLEVEGNLGGHVRTTLLWDAMRTWFEEEVARPGGPRVLNATAGGARIRGVPPVDLGGVLDVLPSRPPRRLHECLARRAPGEARRRMGEARREASTRTEALVGDFGRLRAEVGEALAALAAWDRAAPVSPGHPAWRLTDRVLERLEALVPTDALPRSVLYPSIVALNQRMATHGALADVSALAGCLAEAEGFLRTGEEWLPRLAGVLGGSP